MSKKNVPAHIVTGVTAMLEPYCPGITFAGLLEALKRRECSAAVAASSTIRKPLTRHDAAAILQVSIPSINRYMRAGTLRSFKIGKRLVRIDPASVEALLHSNEEK